MQGHYVVCAGGRSNKFFELNEFCDEFLQLDLRVLENCKKATAGCDWCVTDCSVLGVL